MKSTKRGGPKTLYFDIDTVVKLTKVAKKAKVSQSKVVKRLVAMTPFDQMVEMLNKELA